MVCFVCLLRLPARSEVGALSRLRQLLVGGRRHVSADLDQHGLHGEVALPGCYAGELGEVDLRGKTAVLVRSFKETLVRFKRIDCPEQSVAQTILISPIYSSPVVLGGFVGLHSLLLCHCSR